MTPALRKKISTAIILIPLAGILLFLTDKFLSQKENISSTEPSEEKQASSAKTKVNSPSEEATYDPHQPLKLKFDVLGGWKYVEGKTPIPDSINQLQGKSVEVTGFMMPINQTQNITHFILIQSLWGCCFGQTPAPNHIITIHMKQGKTVEFYPDPVKVIGTFSVGETREEGYLISIYQITAEKVIAK